MNAFVKEIEVDGATAERLKRGRYPIERKLDLHGLTREEAYGELKDTLLKSAAQGKRCLLVITGKGAGGGGVLKQSLPAWLDLPEFKPLILAFCAARPEHGGDGAFYVLLRRREKRYADG